MGISTDLQRENRLFKAIPFGPDPEAEGSEKLATISLPSSYRKQLWGSAMLPRLRQGYFGFL